MVGALRPEKKTKGHVKKYKGHIPNLPYEESLYLPFHDHDILFMQLTHPLFRFSEKNIILDGLAVLDWWRKLFNEAPQLRAKYFFTERKQRSLYKTVESVMVSLDV